MPRQLRWLLAVSFRLPKFYRTSTKQLHPKAPLPRGGLFYLRVESVEWRVGGFRRGGASVDRREIPRVPSRFKKNPPCSLLLGEEIVGATRRVALARKTAMFVYPKNGSMRLTPTDAGFPIRSGMTCGRSGMTEKIRRK